MEGKKGAISDCRQKFYNEENSLIKWSFPERIFSGDERTESVRSIVRNTNP